jgi:hypothetical protein
VVIQNWAQLRNRHYWMELKNIQGVGLDVEADTTVEQVFLKRPIHFCCWILVTLMWIKQLNRR